MKRNAITIFLVCVIIMGLIELSIQVGIDREKQAQFYKEAAQNNTPPSWSNITPINASEYGL
jgi:hypothetical protein